MGGPGRFSVVVPAFDREATLERTLTSIRAAADERERSGAAPTEILVVDDGSSDRTAAIAAQIAAEDGRVQVLVEPNAGVSAARNLGASHATGRWLAFLDSDDEVEASWLTSFGAALDGGARLVFAPGRTIEPDGSSRTWRITPLGPVFGDVDGLFNPGMFALARHDFDAVGGYAPALTYSENTELAIRLTEHLETDGPIATVALDEPLVTITIPPAGGGSNANTPAARLASALYILDVHEVRLTRDRRTHARYWAIAGVAAARLDRPTLARRCFIRAARTDPASARHLARAIAVGVPSARSRLWPVDP